MDLETRHIEALRFCFGGRTITDAMTELDLREVQAAYPSAVILDDTGPEPRAKLTVEGSVILKAVDDPGCSP